MQKTIHIDDINGSTDGVETIRFSVGKETWEIDLSEKNRALLIAALDPFTQHARRVKKPVKRASTGAATRRQKIREWAQNNGHEIARSGKIPDAIIAAYEAATASQSAKK